MTAPMSLVEDRLDIRDLYLRWCVLLDTGQARAWAELCAKGGVFGFPALDVRAEGTTALWAFAAGVHERERGLTRHYMHSILVNVNEHAVTARADTDLLDLRPAGGARIVKTDHYEDRLALTAAGRRLAARCLDWDAPGASDEIGTRAWDHAPSLATERD